MFRRMNRHVLGVCSELPYPPSKDNFSRWETTMLETVSQNTRYKEPGDPIFTPESRVARKASLMEDADRAAGIPI